MTKEKPRIRYTADGKIMILLMVGLRVQSKIDLQKVSKQRINKFLGVTK
jgi:hypothetical protein